MGAQYRYLPDKSDDRRRMHLHHGPIDLIIDVVARERELAYHAACQRFDNVLQELVDELPQLRECVQPEREFRGPVAQRMARATLPFHPQFLTPMAAVAGAVADEILSVMGERVTLEKASVNNGGDTAFFLAPGQTIKAVIAMKIPTEICIDARSKFRGVATSGWRGRSQSLGIADCVCVIGENAAMADAAATMIANAVDLPGHPLISRKPANAVFADSDLGDRLVTVGVGALRRDERKLALAQGKKAAQHCFKRDMIGAALLVLGEDYCQIGAENMIDIKTGELADA